MKDGDDFFGAHFIVHEPTRPQPRSTLTVAHIPSDVQSGDVVFYSPGGTRRGKRREWPWVVATLALIFLSTVPMYMWMVTHPAVRDVGLLVLSGLIFNIAGLVGGFTVGRAWSK